MAHANFQVNEFRDEDFDDSVSVISKMMNTSSETDNSQKICVQIPKFYINVDENKPDQITYQYILLDYKHIGFFGNKFLEIENENNFAAQLAIQNDLIKQVLNNIEKSKPATQTNEQEQVSYGDFKNILTTVLKQLNAVCEQTAGLMIFDEINRIENTPITFNVVRKYFNNAKETSILDSFQDTSYNGKSFYMQMSEQEEYECRNANNDTDLNRFHYISHMIIDTLLMKPGRIADTTIKMYNFILTYMLIVTFGEEYLNRYESDTTLNLIGFMVDLGVRTRLIQKYINQKSKYDEKLQSNINKSYGQNTNTVLLNMCKLKTARDRIIYCMEQLNKTKLVQYGVNLESYEEYCKLLLSSAITIDGNTYYKFDSALMQSFFNLNCFASLCKLAKDFNDDNLDLNDTDSAYGESVVGTSSECGSTTGSFYTANESIASNSSKRKSEFPDHNDIKSVVGTNSSVYQSAINEEEDMMY